MKLTIFALTLLAIVVFGSATSLLKVKKVKSKAKTKDDYGSGSWTGGYDCPEILIGANNNEPANQGRATLRATLLENPTDDASNLGLVLDFSSGPNGDLQKILSRVTGTNKWYLPYRWMSSQCTYTNPTGYKYIEFRVTNDANQGFRFRVNLPWARWSYYINDTEGQNLCTLINNHQTRVKGIVNEARQQVKTSSSQYAIKKPIATAASTSDADKKKAVTDLTAKKTANDQLLATAKTDLDTKTKEYETFLLSKSDNLTKYDAAVATVNNIQSQIAAYKVKLEEAKANASAAATSKADLQAIADRDKATCQAEFTTLSTYASNRAAEVNAAKTAMENLDEANITTNLNKITPVS